MANQLNNKHIAIVMTVFIFSFLGCNKEILEKKFTGILFYPETQNKLSIKPIYGYGLMNDVLYLPMSNPDSNRILQVFSYNFGTRKLVTNNSFFSIDSTRLGGLIQFGADKYIATAIDLKKPFIYKGSNNYPDKLVIIDKNYKVLKQKFLTDTTRDFIYIKPLPNNTFITIFHSYAPLSGIVMNCYNQDLERIWQTSLNGVGIDEISISDNSIYFLARSYDLDQYFTVKQFNFNGKLVKSRTSARSNFDAQITTTDDKALVFSKYNKNDKRNLLGINIYDQNLNNIETKQLSTQSFSFTDAFEFQFSSNIVKNENDYYFTINVDNYSTKSIKIIENKLVKINDKLEIEWVKPIDSNRKIYDLGYLIYCNDHLLNIGKSIWNGVEGLSFIQTDLEGNIVK